MGRLVKEGLDRHDPARPPRRARRPAGSRSAGAERTSAPKQEVRLGADADPTRNRPDAGAAASTAKLRAASVCNSTSPPKPRDPQAHAFSVARRPAKTAGSPPSAPKPLRDGQGPSPSTNARSVRPAGANASAATSRSSGRAVPAAVRREVWQRDGGRCSYVDPRTGRRCASRHLLEIDHRIPYARGGGAERANLRLLCGVRDYAESRSRSPHQARL